MFYFLLSFKNPNGIRIMGKLHTNSQGQKREEAVAESDWVITHTANQKIKSKLKEKRSQWEFRKFLPQNPFQSAFLVPHS